MTSPDMQPQPAASQFTSAALDASTRHAADVPYGTEGTPLRAARDALGRAREAITGSLVLGETNAADEKLPPAYRQRAVTEAADVMGRQAAEALDAAEAAFLIAGDQAEADALPRLGKNDQLTARADAEMQFRNVPPAELPLRMAQAAREDSSIAALVASDWGRRYLASRGIDDTRQHAAVRMAAVEHALGSSDPKRKAAAELRVHGLGQQRRALDAAKGASRGAAEDLARLAQQAGRDPAKEEIRRLRRELARATGKAVEVMDD